MAKVNIPITTGFYESYSLPISAQQCKNFFVHDTGFGPAIIGTPGITKVVSAGETAASSSRGMHVKNGILYSVNGDKLYRVNKTNVSASEVTYSLTELGTITGDGNVSTADNGSQLIILNNTGDGWIYDESAGTPFQAITDPDFSANGDPEYVVYLDGYFVLSTSEKKIITSALNDGLSYNALDFASAEADPDEITGLQVVSNQLVVIGTETTEIFTNVGGSAFPLQRINGSVVNVGTRFPGTIQPVGETFFMIGESKQGENEALIFEGRNYRSVSNPGISRLLNTENLEGSVSISYAEIGEVFVGCTVGKSTIIYGLNTGSWHERVYSVPGEQDKPSRARSAIKAYGDIFVGDSDSGAIGIQSIDTFTEFGDRVFRAAASPRIADKIIRKSVPRIEVLAETGAISANEPDVVVSLSISRDGGKTFNYRRDRTLGSEGEYEHRVVWRRNGSFKKGVVVRLETDSASKIVLIEMVVDIL